MRRRNNSGDSPFLPDDAIFPLMKALYRILFMILLALPALNVLAASIDLNIMDTMTMPATCMAHESHVSCHPILANKSVAHPANVKSQHETLCCHGSCQFCIPSLLPPQAWIVTPVVPVGIFVPTLPGKLAGITISPPHRPPSLAC